MSKEGAAKILDAIITQKQATPATVALAALVRDLMNRVAELEAQLSMEKDSQLWAASIQAAENMAQMKRRGA